MDASAQESHFVDHLAPIWKTMPAKRLGTFYVANDAVQKHAAALGLETVVGPVPEGSRAALVASWGDLKRLRPETKAIYMEHGSGINYGDGNPSYAGGNGRESVMLFLCPNERVEELNRAAWPYTPSVVVGCPKLDTYEVRPMRGRTVAVSFHWPCMIAPEASWAFPFYRNFLRNIAERAECEVLGHSHPRAWSYLGPFYKRVGIRPVRSFAEVLDRADLYVVDNSSTLYEFAAAGRPTVVVNSPRYRRDVHYGLRFWEGIPGPQVNHGTALSPTIKRMLDGEWKDWEDNRESAVKMAYGPDGNDGKATKRAVEAIKKALTRVGA
jgi:hypothetical protein